MFINQFGQINSAQDVLAYADFLLEESGQAHSIPVDLSQIFKRFQIPTPNTKTTCRSAGTISRCQQWDSSNKFE